MYLTRFLLSSSDRMESQTRLTFSVSGLEDALEQRGMIFGKLRRCLRKQKIAPYLPSSAHPRVKSLRDVVHTVSSMEISDDLGNEGLRPRAHLSPEMNKLR